MALCEQTGASEKLPQRTVSGTLLSRDQLRRQLSQGQLDTRPAAGAAADQYATPIKKTQTADAGQKTTTPVRKVTFTEDPPPSPLLRPLGPAPGGAAAAAAAAAAGGSSVRGVSSSLVQDTSRSRRDTHPSVRLRHAQTDGLEEDGALDASVSLYEDDEGKVKGVVELSTQRQRRVPFVKVRVICLIDVSGSMLLKGDKRQQRSKIAILKNMAVDIIDALEDEEDFFGVMTFGEESRVICPLSRVSASTRSQVKSTVSELDKTRGFSAVTDLSSALLQAVTMLTTQQKEEGLLYRNCIIVFSDGEVNAGTTDPKELVHVTREQIRACSMPQELLADLWVNVSCVTTGSNFSHSLYLLSKMCGGDAYFYVDGSKERPETDMLIPLMLRKTACAQMVSVSVRAANGAVLDTARCSQEYSIRRRRGGREVERDTMAYFLHDMPVGVSKTFHISLDAHKVPAAGERFLSVEVQYVDSLGVLHSISKSVRRQEVLSLRGDRPRALEEVVAKLARSELRELMQRTCRNVAAAVEAREGDVTADVSAAVQGGLREVGALLRDLRLDDGPAKSQVDAFAEAVCANLRKLESLAGRGVASGDGRCWQVAKAMSSAVARQLPTVTTLLAQPHVLCPPPAPAGCVDKRTKALSIFLGFGAGEEEEGGSPLLSAARGVAQSLADVLKAVEDGSL